jgi:hypothetical protein
MMAITPEYLGFCRGGECCRISVIIWNRLETLRFYLQFTLLARLLGV